MVEGEGGLEGKEGPWESPRILPVTWVGNGDWVGPTELGSTGRHWKSRTSMCSVLGTLTLGTPMKNTSIVKKQFHYTDLEFRGVWAGCN